MRKCSLDESFFLFLSRFFYSNEIKGMHHYLHTQECLADRLVSFSLLIDKRNVMEV